MLQPSTVSTSAGPYQLTEELCHAVNGALAAQRPLLVRGEPGTGKSELARAAAVALGWAYHRFVIDVQVESRDLLYTTDPVRRLAEAQLLGHLGKTAQELRDELDIGRFTSPGPLWWGFDWASAKEQAVKVGDTIKPSPDSGSSEFGCVVLIDEIDKADASVPNGLLEALGEGEFFVPGVGKIQPKSGRLPLVVITTNEERMLPDAFLRRCFVIQIDLPKKDEPLRKLLLERGRIHFPEASEGVLKETAELLIQNRQHLRQRGQTPPGQAEFLDLLRAVTRLAPNDDDEQMRLLKKLCMLVMDKHPREA